MPSTLLFSPLTLALRLPTGLPTSYYKFQVCLFPIVVYKHLGSGVSNLELGAGSGQWSEGLHLSLVMARHFTPAMLWWGKNGGGGSWILAWAYLGLNLGLLGHCWEVLLTPDHPNFFPSTLRLPMLPSLTCCSSVCLQVDPISSQ